MVQYIKEAGYGHLLCHPEGELLAAHLQQVHDGKSLMCVPHTVSSDVAMEPPVVCICLHSTRIFH